MRLVVVSEGRNVVAAAYTSRGDSCPAIDFLYKEVEANMEAHVDGLFSLFESYAESGVGKLTESQFHPAGANGEVFRFRKGRLRIYCFKDGNNLVIATHGCVKKQNATDDKDIGAALRMKKQYFADKALGNLVWERDDEY